MNSTKVYSGTGVDHAAALAVAMFAQTALNRPRRRARALIEAPAPTQAELDRRAAAEACVQAALAKAETRRQARREKRLADLGRR